MERISPGANSGKEEDLEEKEEKAEKKAEKKHKKLETTVGVNHNPPAGTFLQQVNGAVFSDFGQTEREEQSNFEETKNMQAAMNEINESERMAESFKVD